MKLALQVSPESKAAYFHQSLDVAERELAVSFPDRDIERSSFGGLDYLLIEAEEADFLTLARLSFVFGLFEVIDGLLRPIDVKADWLLHEDFVFGSKFRGKTNERLTQLLINVGLAHLSEQPNHQVKLLDPMAGRGTSLLWAMRYGLSAWGIEQDNKALDDVRQIVKKWTKIHRQKHQMKEGFIGKPNRQNLGKFIDFTVDDSKMRFICGDAQQADQWAKEKFDLIVSDLPYGVQHFTTEKTRNPLAVVEQCAPAWVSRLKKSGALVLAFNHYQPKRQKLIELFESHGLVAREFSAQHRMSESIVRDVVVFQFSES